MSREKKWVCGQTTGNKKRQEVEYELESTLSVVFDMQAGPCKVLSLSRSRFLECGILFAQEKGGHFGGYMCWIRMMRMLACSSYLLFKRVDKIIVSVSVV